MRRTARDSAVDVTAEYRRQLLELASELATSARDLAAARRVQLRLLQWLEDLRSVSADAALASEVEGVLLAMATALKDRAAVPDQLADALEEIARRLVELARGAPSQPHKPKKSRFAFWK